MEEAAGSNFIGGELALSGLSFRLFFFLINAALVRGYFIQDLVHSQWMIVFAQININGLIVVGVSA